MADTPRVVLLKGVNVGGSRRLRREEEVRFVGVFARSPRPGPALPLALPASSRWLVKVLGRKGRFVVGVHRREMKAIGALQELERVYGAPLTVRGWRTLQRVAKLLAEGETTEEHGKGGEAHGRKRRR